MKFPDKLSRRAIMQTFNRLEPVTWEKLFMREDSNGIRKYRVPSEPHDYIQKAYYDSAGIKAWLIREGYYTADEFYAPRFGGQRLAMSA
jgi:hypothetical protein